MRCVEHYVRDDVDNSRGRDNIPIREGTLVTFIQALSRGYTERSEEVTSLRAEIASMRAEIASSDDRRRKAEERSDLLASAYSLVEKEIPKRKRARDD
jgi:tRNA A37 N6-isopentenylltransferase MiaA